MQPEFPWQAGVAANSPSQERAAGIFFRPPGSAGDASAATSAVFPVMVPHEPKSRGARAKLAATVAAIVTAIFACCLAFALTAIARQGAGDARPGIEATVGQLAAELSTVCPLADPGDRQAFDACRQALFRDSLVRRSVDTILLWGRPHPRPGESLKATTLTELAPEVWAGLYAPLFMFDGSWHLEHDDSEVLYRARLGALFRNALDPGQYPYPFWHDARKWNDYQAANTVILWISPTSGKIVAGQFTNDGRQRPGLRSEPVRPPPFDGQWMWTDATGATQPAPTLFRGLFSDRNPHLRDLETRYHALANAMRKGHCNDCHVPANPSRMSRLVLLQTPVHAASEIKRLMKAVRDNDMPVDDTMLDREIDADSKETLLQRGAAFEALIDAARAWEEAQRPPR
ncbi:MAG: hypothetical protein AB7F22_32220 [Reyranella sp.]|uniref:hypothetical protein n=1 Tax=Reyranella sp. TaxID=1929291 RepID=UPI003D1343D2